MENKITILNKLSEIQKIEAFFEEFADSKNISMEIKFKIDMILDEILTNIISYGYNDDKEDHIIAICVTLEDENIKIVIEDDGLPFNPLLRPPPDLTMALEERPIGGLGIYLVKSYVSNIDYTRSDEHNILSMTMKISDEEI
jgi:anti-sigma regulatory factor (Ser/Thr protein kinase)